MVCLCFSPKVIQWCTHHKDDPPPPEDDENKEKRTDDIPVWDQEFLKVDQGTLFELILVNTVLLFYLFLCNIGGVEDPNHRADAHIFSTFLQNECRIRLCVGPSLLIVGTIDSERRERGAVATTNQRVKEMEA